MIGNRLLFFKTQQAFEEKKNEIRSDAIVFIKDPAVIWTHDTYYTGGSGGGGSTAQTIELSSPIYYYKFTKKDEQISFDVDDYTAITTLTAIDQTSKVGTTQISLAGEFFIMLVPESLSFTAAVTSRYEPLDIEENFIDLGIFDGYHRYGYIPDVAPESLTLTLTFSI